MSTAKVKKENISYSLKGIELINIELNHPEITVPKDTSFNFEMHFEHRFNIEKKLIFVVFSANIMMDGKLKVGKIKISYTFTISNFTELVNDAKILEIPNEIAITLNSIAISTSRGILYSQLKGTFLHNVLLPLINPTDIKLNKKK